MARLRPFFQNGWLTPCTHRTSPHYNERPAGMQPRLVVLHFISLPAGVFTGETVDALFQGKLLETEDPALAEVRGLKVSSHFFIRRSGELLQYVSADKRAWHAGVSVFEGVSGCNDYSVGIEIEGTGEVPYTAAQYRSLGKVLRALVRAYPIRAVTGHEFIAPGRKSDPGPFMDWSRIRALLPARVRIVTSPQTPAAKAD